MTLKPEEETKRVVVYPEDISALTGKSLKTSRNLLSKARKELGRKPSEFLTYRDVAKFLGWDEDLIRNVLYISYFSVLLWALYLWIFRDDMDLAVIWIIVFILVKVWGIKPFRQFREGWRLISRGRKNNR